MRMLCRPLKQLTSRLCATGLPKQWRAIHTAPPTIADSASVLLPRSLIAVYGQDSPHFLNGLITTRPPEQKRPGVGTGQFSSMLNAKGRVIADLFVYAAHDVPSFQASTNTKSSCYILDVDTRLVDKIMDILDFHVLLSDVEIKHLPQYSVYSLWNDEKGIDTAKLSSFPLCMQDERAPGLAHRVIVDNEAKETTLPWSTPASIEQYTLRRYLFGIPEGPDELIPGKALPLDSCIDYMGGIDFNKGCYMGQELTIRTYHHGNVRKRIMPVVFTETAEEELTDDLYIPKDLQIELGTSIFDENPVPNADMITPMFGSSPFGAPRPKRTEIKKRPSGEIISVLGNVGLAKLRVDTLGHDFRVGDLFVKPMTPFWWPESSIRHE